MSPFWPGPRRVPLQRQLFLQACPPGRLTCPSTASQKPTLPQFRGRRFEAARHQLVGLSGVRPSAQRNSACFGGRIGVDELPCSLRTSGFIFDTQWLWQWWWFVISVCCRKKHLWSCVMSYKHLEIDVLQWFMLGCHVRKRKISSLLIFIVFLFQSLFFMVHSMTSNVFFRIAQMLVVVWSPGSNERRKICF